MGLYLTAFLSGAAIMGLEILGFRLLPPYFGYSIAVWGCLLGIVMAALAAGYSLGGILADRRPDPARLYVMILVAAGYTFLLRLASPAILGFAARFGPVPGSLLASFLLFGVPMTALSTVSPFVIRLVAGPDGVGGTAGRVYAVSTVGSIAGTLLTSFYLIPGAGTHATLTVWVFVLTLVGGLGLVASRRREPLPAPARPAEGRAAAVARRPEPLSLEVEARHVPAPPRPVMLQAAALSLAAGLVASGFSPPVRFELIGRDQARWAERFAGGQEEAVVRVDGGEARVPYILPGPADDWAGGGPHRIRIEFAGPAEASLLLLEVPNAHAEQPPHLTVSANGREVGRVRVRRGIGLDRGDGPALEFVVPIPAAALDPGGRQTLTITNGKGSWVMFSGVRLLGASPAFSVSHYIDPSPPPRWGIALLGLGLAALWGADRREVRRKLPSLFVLSAGLGLLTFLELSTRPFAANWHVVLITHRGIWLLLVLSFVVPLVPWLPSLPRPRLLTAVAFLTGAVGMILELVGFRLLSPFFGYSSYVWGSLLAVVMAALALGYFLGGWLADRRPTLGTLYQSLAATAVVILAAPYAYPFVIRLTASLPLISGSLLAAFLLVFVPMVGLGLVVPLVIRILAASGGVGVAAGRIYAISTVGSIVGTFAGAFFLVTTLGLGESWVAGGLLVLLLLSAHGVGRGAVAGAHWLGALLIFTQPFVPEMSVTSLKGGTRIYETESEYSHLEVIEVGKTVQLVPQLRFVHTIYDETRAFEPIISYGLLPSFLTPEPRTLLHLGMGGGTLARVYLRAHPEIRIDGVDIDGEMIRLGKRFLGLTDDARLRIVIQDARAFLLTARDRRYDVVVWDLFQGGVFVPYYALTREFFELGRDRVAERGVVAVFVARPGDLDRPLRRKRFERLFKSVGNTLGAVFPSVFAYPVTGLGYYFVATREPTALETVRARLEAVGIPELREPLREALRGLAEYRPDPAVPVLTDDLAPVDQLIYDAFFRQ